MKYYKTLLWNDEPELLDDWVAVFVDAGFEDQNIIRVSSASIVEVDEIFVKNHPDIVVLDVIFQKDDSSIGIDIAEKIRARDPLVPIVFITREPQRVYEIKKGLDDLRPAGVYLTKSVMHSGTLEAEFRRVLSYWSASYPEYVLCREAGSLIAEHLGEDSEIVTGLVEVIMAIPLISSKESWHKLVSSRVERALGNLEYGGLKEKFVEMCSLFQDADRFYMAGTESRVHLSHNVKVFLLGVCLLMGCRELRVNSIASVAKLGEDGRSERDCLLDALMAWACVGLTHDTGYLAQNIGGVSERLAHVSEMFLPVLSDGYKLDVEVEWPFVHHAEVGMRLWSSAAVKSGREQGLRDLVASAVKRHDSNQEEYEEQVVLLGPDSWLDFLAVLSDELQDWERYRQSDVPANIYSLGNPWAGFSVAVVDLWEIGEDEGFELSLTFAIRDYPGSVGELVGTPSSDGVYDRFDQLLATIASNLSTTKGFRVTVRGIFATRETKNVSTNRELRQVSNLVC